MNVAEQRLFIQGLKHVRNIVSAGIEASKKDCPCKGLGSSKDCMSRETHNIPRLKVLLEAIFSEMIQTNKKVTIFRQGNSTMNVLHPSLSKSFALSICSRDPMKNSTLEYFCKSTTAKCIARCNHDDSLGDNYCVPLFKLKFLVPTLRHIFCSPKPSKIYGESDFLSSVLRNKLGKSSFL